MRTQRRMGSHRPPDPNISSPLYQRILQFQALSSLRQQGTDVRKFALRLSGAAEGLGYNDAALKDLFKSALEEPLNWRRMRGLEHLTFGQFVEFLEAVAEPDPVQEPRESAPEPAPVREPRESAPEPAPVREPTESATKPAPVQKPSESAPGPAPLKWWFSTPPWWPPALLAPPWPPALPAPPWHPCPPLSPGPLPLHGHHRSPWSASGPPPPRHFLVLMCGASRIRSLKGWLCHGLAGVPWLVTRCLCVFVWAHSLLHVVGAMCSPVYCLTPPLLLSHYCFS